MAAVRVPYLLGHAEIAALFDVKKQTSQKWRTDGTLPNPDLTASGNPYWLLATVLRLSAARDRVTAERLTAYKQSIPQGYDVTSRDQLPPIVGIKETALVLNRNEQTIARWRGREQITQPDLVLSGSPLWLLDTILADARTQGRSIDDHQVQQILAGERPAQQPRGRRTGDKVPRATRKPLPPARTFTYKERKEAVAFLDALFSEDLAVVIRAARRER
ncbi:hypothetical protein [Streptantibioticus ferralitis]|uniref:Uncharacterized protein n=1 Tax=Streptantibioticus ferralitis TaxID=236510 RepID=A0ABT5YRW7_9ACTN|nr:hypothetical protein [Streptantibioticus ferralitis]MDF2254322.1 hypothetical protein [Streptantibioticus ferralitis]